MVRRAQPSWTERLQALDETTRRLVLDASYGPGEYVERFRRAKPAERGKLTAIQVMMLERMSGQTIGYFSKALVYGLKLPPREASAFASLVKGGLLVVVEDPTSREARYRLDKA
jgi:hypothetical protein